MRSYHQGNSEAALELLLSGADSPDASSPQPEAVLGGSMSSGAAAEEEIAALVKAKAAAKYGKLSQAQKDTQLYSAAEGGKTEEVEWLILAGANPNYVSHCSFSSAAAASFFSAAAASFSSAAAASFSSAAAASLSSSCMFSYWCFYSLSCSHSCALTPTHSWHPSTPT